MDAPILRLDQYERQKPHSLTQPRIALEILRGQARQKLRPVASRVFLIGSAIDCDLVLGDPSFPEAYAYLLVEGQAVTIRRLGSGPDLFVSGEQLESCELVRGDVVTFGPFELRLFIDPPIATAAPAVVRFPGTDSTLCDA